jgi:ABC-type branched-subunit amino acid transport system ATPase component
MTVADGLVIENLVAGYGKGTVLDGISLELGPGEALALIGRNGAGKTTLLKAIMGLVRARSGSIRFGKARIDHHAPFEVSRRGIAYVPQGREIFVDLTVEENLLLGNLGAADAAEAFSIFPALESRRRDAAGGLSGGQQQQLAIGRALMAHPQLILLDEPSEGIQPSIVLEITAILRRIASERSMGLILVEQNIEMALALCGRAVFIEQGRIVAEAATSTLRADPMLIEQHLSI